MGKMCHILQHRSNDVWSLVLKFVHSFLWELQFADSACCIKVLDWHISYSKKVSPSVHFCVINTHEFEHFGRNKPHRKWHHIFGHRRRRFWVGPAVGHIGESPVQDGLQRRRQACLWNSSSQTIGVYHIQVFAWWAFTCKDPWRVSLAGPRR